MYIKNIKFKNKFLQRLDPISQYSQKQKVINKPTKINGTDKKVRIKVGSHRYICKAEVKQSAYNLQATASNHRKLIV